jgi:hypothetical protein
MLHGRFLLQCNGFGFRIKLFASAPKALGPSFLAEFQSFLGDVTFYKKLNTFQGIIQKPLQMLT